MKRLLFCLLSLSLLFSAAAQVTYVERFVLAKGDRAGGVVYHPQKFEAGKKYPVLFVLHGIGEQGNGSLAALQKLAKHGNYSPAETFGKQYGMIIVEPQTPGNWQYGEVDELHQWCLDSLGSAIDPTRFYLTGTSLGGGGVYRYLGSNANAHLKFAAAAPMGSGGHQWFVTNAAAEENVSKTKVPTWAFHNRGDNVVWPEASTLYFFERALKAGNNNMWVSINDLAGHTFPAYNRGKGSTLSDFKYVAANGYVITPSCNLYEWLLKQQIGKPAVAPCGPLNFTKAPVPRPAGQPLGYIPALVKPAGITVVQPPVPNPIPTNPTPTQPAPTITGVTHASDGSIPYSLAVEIFYSDKTKVLIKAPAGDRIIGSYYSMATKSVTIDFLKATDKVIGPTK